MHFSPGIAEALKLPLPNAKAPLALYCYSSTARTDHNSAKRIEIWTNLPTQQNDHSTQDSGWTAIPFLQLYTADSSDSTEGFAQIETQGQVAEIALDPLHDWTSLPQRYEYTIRIRDLEGEVEWLGNGGRNGEIVFTPGVENGLEGVEDGRMLSQEVTRVRGEKERGLRELLRKLENNGKPGEDESDAFKLLNRYTTPPQSTSIDAAVDSVQRNNIAHFPFLSHRLSHPLTLPVSPASAIILSKATHDEQFFVIGLWNPSDSSTAEVIIDLLDISDAISSSLRPDESIAGRYTVVVGETIQVVEVEEISSIKNRIFARPVARIVLLPGEYHMVSITRVFEVESSIGDGKKLGVAVLGTAEVDEFGFNNINSIQLYSDIIPPSRITPSRAGEVAATEIPPLSFPSAKSVNHAPLPPPIPRIFLLPLYFLTIIQLLSSTTLDDLKSDPKSDVLDLVKDLVTSPVVTTWNESLSIMRYMTAIVLGILSVVLSKGIGQGANEAVRGGTSLSMDQHTGGECETSQESPGMEGAIGRGIVSRNKVASAGTLAIAFESGDSPLRLYFPSPDDKDRLSSHSIVKITFNKDTIDNSRISTERAQDGSGMVVSIDCRSLGGTEGGVVEISC